MKLAILAASYLPKVGGAQVFAYNIARQLTARGHDVSTFVPRESWEALRPRYRDGLRALPRRYYGLVRRVPWAGRLWAQRWLRRVQRAEGFDSWLVIVTYPSGYVATCLEGIVPIVLRGSGEDIQKSPELGYGLRLDAAAEARIGRTVRSYDRVVALTESVRTDFASLDVPDGDVVTIPNGVNLNWFERDREVAAIRGELGWPTDRPVILTTGRNHRKKGFNLIPEIAEALRRQGLSFRWYLVGLGAEEIEPEVRSRGLDGWVIACPEVGVPSEPGSDIRFPDRRLVDMYQAADIFAFPSLLETFGMVLLEAMAAGAAVVTTDAPGCRDVVRHEENGLQAPAGDPQSFAEQLGRLLGDDRLRQRLSAAARVYVLDYSWDNVARQYEELFSELASASGGTHGRAQMSRER